MHLVQHHQVGQQAHQGGERFQAEPRLDIDRLTPVEALMKLNEIKRLLKAKKTGSSL